MFYTSFNCFYIYDDTYSILLPHCKYFVMSQFKSALTKRISALD